MIDRIDGAISGDIRSPSQNIQGNVTPVNAAIRGGVIGGGGSKILVNTTAGWNAKPDLVGTVNTVYVYSDHHTDEQGNPIPSFKVGDGTTYLLDLPFNDDLMTQHVEDATIHITQEEREFWNNKNRATINGENLILTQF